MRSSNRRSGRIPDVLLEASLSRKVDSNPERPLHYDVIAKARRNARPTREQLHGFVEILHRRAVELQPLLDDDPSHATLVGEPRDRCRVVRIDRAIEHQHRKARTASGGEEKRILAGKEDDGVLARDVGIEPGDEFLEIGQPLAGHRESAQRGKM